MCSAYLHDLCAVLEVGEGPHDILVDELYSLLPVTVEATYQLSYLPCHRHTTLPSLGVRVPAELPSLSQTHYITFTRCPSTSRVTFSVTDTLHNLHLMFEYQLIYLPCLRHTTQPSLHVRVPADLPSLSQTHYTTFTPYPSTS